MTQSPGDPIPNYTFELTTNFFDVDKDGYLVASGEKLDRDPPNTGKLRFQVIVCILMYMHVVLSI